MTVPVYERYKECLRRGHVAALRGQLEDALEAYTEAALVAPDRALPHTSRGAVLMRQARPDDALGAFSNALDPAPRDEAALLGRADALLALGRRVDAADAVDRVAELQEQDGRIREATDTARRALDLAESRTRRRQLERLTEARLSIPADEEAATALARVSLPAESAVTTGGRPLAEPVGAGQVGLEVDARASMTADAGTVVTAQAGGVVPVEAGAALTADAERLVQAGDPAAPERCLAAATAHRAAGRVDAAIDACYLGLAVAPGDTSIHLALAELYVERGWQGPATEKLLLLGRLVDLEGDPDLRARVCAIVDAGFRHEPRLAALCS